MQSPFIHFRLKDTEKKISCREIGQNYTGVRVLVASKFATEAAINQKISVLTAFNRKKSCVNDV